MNGRFDLGSITPSKYFFSIAIVLGALFALTSGDESQSIILNLFQWQLQTIVPMAFLIVSHIALLRLSSFSGKSAWFGLACSGLIGATLFVPLALFIELWIEARSFPVILSNALINEWFGVVPPVVICWIAINAPWVAGYRLEKDTVCNSPPEIELEVEKSNGDVGINSSAGEFQSAPAFMNLVPDDKRGEIIFLKSELHYLQVVTDQGTSLILCSLTDAIDQLSLAPGFSPHRSYWVATNAIDSFTQKGRQGLLMMNSGQTVPVSRGKLEEVSGRFTETDRT